MSSLWQTDEEKRALEEKLRPRLTDEFLATLADAAEISLGDQIAVDGFVIELFEIAGKEPPERYRRGTTT